MLSFIEKLITKIKPSSLEQSKSINLISTAFKTIMKIELIS